MSIENLQIVRDLMEFDFECQENKIIFIEKYLNNDEIINTFWEYISKHKSYYHQKRRADILFAKIKREYNDNFIIHLFYIMRKFGTRYIFHTKRNKHSLRLDLETGREAYKKLLLLLESRVKNDVKHDLLKIFPQITNLYVADLIKIIVDYV